MRGKARQQEHLAAQSGITPACAGKSREYRVSDERSLGSPPRMRGKAPTGFCGSTGRKDHPRMCGEKQRSAESVTIPMGSPPHVRGKDRLWQKRFHEVGITPACAGKRLKRSRSTVPPVAIVPLFPSVCNKPVVSDGSPAGRDAPLFLPAENAVPASPAYNLRSL